MKSIDNMDKVSVNKGKKIFIFNLILPLFTIFLIIVLCEILIRIPLFLKNRQSFETIIQNLPKSQKDSESTLGQIIQPSMNRRIIYELRPNIEVFFKKVLVKINSRGWRSDMEFTIDKPRNITRIVGLGDSFMFGWGVSQNKDYLTILNNHLNKIYAPKNRKYEIINTAVPGYNTIMEIETLKQKALIFRPDIVIIEFTGDDLDLPPFIYESIDPFSLKELYCISFLARGFNIIRKNFELFQPPSRPMGIEWKFEDYSKKIPKQYKDMVGFVNFTNALLELKKIKENNHFEVIIYLTATHPLATVEKIEMLSKQFGFYVLEDIQDISKSYLILSKQDGHPSELAHSLMAKVLLNYIIMHFKYF